MKPLFCHGRKIQAFAAVCSCLMFGAVGLIRGQNACAPPPDGLVSWWQAESNALDVIGGNNGQLQTGAAYAPGRVGTAFNFDGLSSKVDLGDPVSLAFTNSFSIEGWIWVNALPLASQGHGQILFRGDPRFCLDPYYFSVRVSGNLRFHIEDAQETLPCGVDLETGPIALQQWKHVAAVFDAENGSMQIYIDGQLSAQTNTTIRPFQSLANGGTSIGNLSLGQNGQVFNGLIDELAVYGRALSGAEIAAIYAAGSAGKCVGPVAPVIYSQPASVTANVGDSVTFSVAAGGSESLAYQWKLDGADLIGATTSVLNLNSVKLADAGSYSVAVSNSVGGVVSSNAILAVTPTCAPPPTGLVSWWRGEGNAMDSVFSNNGVQTNGISYAPGVVGQAFVFDGTTSQITIPGSPSLNLSNLTIEAWISPADLTTPRPILEYANATGPCSLNFWYNIGAGAQPVPGAIFGFVRDSSNPNNNFYLASAGGLLTSNQWSHVTLTYDSVAGVSSLYLNGRLVATNIVGFPVHPNTSLAVNVGYRPIGSSDLYAGFRLAGKLDEVSLYNRALTQPEIQAIYGAESAGKCIGPVAPVIYSQPASVTANVGDSVSFSVAAGGSEPLVYQWKLDGADLIGATTSVLNLNSFKPADAGSYSVVISNSVGGVVSSNATLAVAPTCAPPPTGLLGWWRGEGDATDSFGTNSGTLVNAVSFVSGEVGQAFSFTAISSGVNLGNPPGLQLQDFSLEAWIRRGSATRASYDIYGLAHVLGGAWGGYGMGLNDSGNIFLSKIGYSNVYSTNRVIDTAKFHHVVVTKTGSNVMFYIDGAAEAGSPYDPGFVFNGTFAIGARGSDYAATFLGSVDEASIYGRALTSAEVQSLYLAGSTGKCPILPSIFRQPADQTVAVGTPVAFTVGVVGTTPLAYQWEKNGTALSGATTSILKISNAQLGDFGIYSVAVSNAAGTVASSNAKLTVNPAPPCEAPPAGLVAWWKGEGDATDLVGGNNGTLEGGTNFAAGEVGQAFAFNGINQFVEIPDSPALDPSNALSLEAWVYVSGNPNTDLATIVTKFSPTDPQLNQYQLETHYANGRLNFRPLIFLPSGYGLVDGNTTIQFNTWYHVAMTYDGTSLKLYVNGALDGSVPASGAIAPTAEPLRIGGPGSGPWWFNGRVDEVSLYDRALSSAEVQAIYQAGAGGKCVGTVAPSLISQPQNQTALVGGVVSFGVAAGGSLPLSYQWQKDGVALSGGTISTLTLTNVQLSDSGSYSVIVSNAAGVIVSSNAVLIVNALLSCQPAPAGLVSWWQAQSNAQDLAGINNGTLVGGATFAPGEVGAGFSFNGAGAIVEVPDDPSLRFTNELTVELWYKDAGAPAGHYYGLIAKRGAYPSGCNYGIDMFNGTPGILQVYIQDPNYAGYLVSTSPLPSPGAFHHVAATFRQSAAEQVELKTYVDGQLVQVGTVPGNLARAVNTAPLTIGADDPNETYFMGVIDEPTIYNRALSASEVLGIYNARTAGKCVQLLPPAILTSPTNQGATIGETVVLSVAATGSLPLSYQWQFNGIPISSATNTSLTLSNVSLSSSGSYSVIVTNLAGSVLSAPAVLTVTLPPATVWVGSATVAADGTVSLPVNLAANGNENALGFSLDFDPTLLTNPVVVLGSGAAGASLFPNVIHAGIGQLGVAIALPSGQTFAAGTQQVAVVSFASPLVTKATSTPITFGTFPVTNQVADASGNPLPATFDSGTVSLPPSQLEADASPRPTGDGALTVSDWVLIGRYVARLDSPTNALEFQKADCAPRDTLGDGQLTVSDWVQAGRYVAGLDPAVRVGGPTSAIPQVVVSSTTGPIARRTQSNPRQVQLIAPGLMPGQTGTVQVLLQAQGDENALAFSLSFDPASLVFVGASLGNAAAGATLNLNANQSAQGRLGCVLALNANQSFPAGSRQVVNLNFRAASAMNGKALISFNDLPVPREMSDSTASVLAADYVNASVTVSSLPILKISNSAQTLNLSWPTAATGFVLQESTDIHATQWTTVTVSPSVVNDQNVATVATSGTTKFYRLYRP